MNNVKFKSTNAETLFFDELKREVYSYFETAKKNTYGNAEMLSKFFLWVIFWMISWYAIILLRDHFWLAVLTGVAHMFTHVMIAFNVAHDANHNAMFKSKRANTFVGYIIELLGCSRKMWVLSHNQEHHSFVNVHQHDNNIDGFNLVRLCPHDKWAPRFKYQWLYAPFVYGLVTFNYATFRDIKLLFRYSKDRSTRLSPKFYVEFALFKIIYYSYLFFIPIFVFGVSFKIIVAYFLLGHFVNGLFLTIIFVTGHLVESTTYPDVENNIVSKNWAVHVISTTCDYSTRSSFMQWLIGGINLHVAHHLFPKICHVHYKHISPIIRRVARKHGYACQEIPLFTTAVKSHFKLLKLLGREHMDIGSITLSQIEPVLN